VIARTAAAGIEPTSQHRYREANGGELLVKLPDRLRVAPRLQVQPEPAHILDQANGGGWNGVGWVAASWVAASWVAASWLVGRGVGGADAIIGLRVLMESLVL
jgi:hypothetical protein